jgi:hypothetical protein
MSIDLSSPGIGKESVERGLHKKNNKYHNEVSHLNQNRFFAKTQKNKSDSLANQIKPRV